MCKWLRHEYLSTCRLSNVPAKIASDVGKQTQFKETGHGQAGLSAAVLCSGQSLALTKRHLFLARASVYQFLSKPLPAIVQCTTFPRQQEPGLRLQHQRILGLKGVRNGNTVVMDV